MDGNNKAIWPGWETTRLIGRGSFGAVYEIQRKLFEDDDEVEKAALKVISIPQNDSDIEEMYTDGYDEESVTSTFHAHLKSIVAEYSLMRKMNGSSNIVNCDDVRYVQHDDGIGWDIYIKMELLTPLTKALPATVSEDQVIRIAMDMCAALELCSKHNIVHRDIKPQNIFVSPNGDYKLGDFGIAKTVEKTMGGTKTGTYKYMAPEVYNNRPYNSTADIYSLGLVLYWLLNERRMPFMPLPPAKLSAGMDEQSRQRRFSGEKIPAPKNGSEELKRIVLKGCAFDPKDRYQSAREMWDALRDMDMPARKSDTEIKSEPALEIISEDKTVGPVFSHKPSEIECDKTTGPAFSSTFEDLEKTVGPDFNKKEMFSTEDEDWTTGSEFTKKNTPKPEQKKSTIKTWIVVAIMCALVVLVFGGIHKNSDMDTCVNPDGQYQNENVYKDSLALATDPTYVDEKDAPVLVGSWFVIHNLSGESGMLKKNTNMLGKSTSVVDISACCSQFLKGRLTFEKRLGSNNVSIPASDFNTEWTDTKLLINAKDSLEAGIYEIRVECPMEHDLCCTVGYGKEGDIYISEKSNSFFASHIQNKKYRTYLMRTELGLVATETYENRTKFMTSYEICGIESNRNGIAYPTNNGTFVKFVTQNFFWHGHEDLIALEYNGRYLAADEWGNVYLSEELTEECYWITERMK